MTDLPAGITYGKVVGQFLLSVPDSDDPGSEPDSAPASGTVKFVPRNPNQKVMVPEGPLVSGRALYATLDANGFLSDAQGNPGVWLVTGVYDVAFVIKTVRLSPIAIQVTELHTATEPLDLVAEIPANGQQLSGGQYGALSSRITVLESVVPITSLEIGEVDTSAPGAPAEAEITGEPPALTLDLTIPQGETGPPNILTIGTVTTSIPGSAAEAEITGTSPAQELDLVIPRGETGPMGPGTSYVELNTDDGEAVFSVVDNAGRRSWLEVSPSGGAPERVKTLLQGWSKEPAPAAGGYAYAVVDTNGSLSELSIDESGRVPQWVIDRWASRMSLGIPTVTLPEIEVPSVIYALIGAEAQMIHKHYIKALSEDYNVKVTNGVNGTRTLNDRWKVNAVSATSSAITVSVFDRAMAQVATLATSLVANDATLATPCRLLPIGDSITRTGIYAKTGAQLVGGDTYGTRTIGGVFNEGRGGWSMASYFTNIGTAGATAIDSPFIFPVGVAPAMFLGNTDFWKGVVGATGTTDYSWAGFQQMARAGFATSGPFLFDATGYPVTPAEGNVVIDPNQAAGSTWRKYTSGAWTTMAPQPSTEFNFASYMTRYAAAFAGGNPTVISIMLGTNDFYAAYTDAAFTTFAGRMDTLIASIRAWSATVPIILCTPPVGGYQDDWPVAGVHEFEYRNRMYQYVHSLLGKYDTAATRTNKVYLSSFLGSVDDADFGTTNTVHPDTPGHTSMGQWLAGAIANALN